jgi:hypothetical protein
MSNMMGPGSQPPTGRPGQMTAVMRAMTQATGPKVLRIGLVTGGRIIEERIVKQRTTVTVGPSEKAMFVIQAPNIPPQFKLFELVEGGYVLNFLDGMSGRVALQTGITDLQALKGQARRTGDRAYQVKLTEDARGKIVVGETTFLFQFVAPPPVQPRPQLPLSVKAGNQIDWRLVIIGAFTFLFHFAPILFLFSDWNDRSIVFDTGANVSVIDPTCERDQNAAPEQAVHEACPLKPTVSQQSKQDDTSQQQQDQPQATPDKKPQAKQAAAQAPAQAPPDQGQAAANAAQQLLLKKLLALGGGPGSEFAQGDRGVSAPVNVSNIAGQADATGQNGPLDKGVAGNGSVVPGGNKGLTNVGTNNTDNTNSNAPGTATATHVTGVLTGTGVNNPGHLAGNAESVVRGQLAAAARSCYQRALDQNPNLAGTVSVVITVGPSGEAAGVSASGVDPSVAGCISGAARRLNYGAVQGGGTATVSASFSFVPQH